MVGSWWAQAHGEEASEMIFDCTPCAGAGCKVRSHFDDSEQEIVGRVGATMEEYGYHDFDYSEDFKEGFETALELIRRPWEVGG